MVFSLASWYPEEGRAGVRCAQFILPELTSWSDYSLPCQMNEEVTQSQELTLRGNSSHLGGNIWGKEEKDPL